jgi:NAD(P)-dependent dehydrogenase (short-subunit alcohol dehydrogenase family)
VVNQSVCGVYGCDLVSTKVAAGTIAFLASDAAAWITGETMVIDGGQRLGNAAPYRFGTNAGA